MKVKVIKPFNDLQNDFKLRKVGEEFEVSKDRASELESKGFVTAVAEEKTTAKAKSAKAKAKTAFLQ
ncbi:MAG: hypothetical protein LUF33_03655 [Clostridiales bacterium]|nr:hypothetical protein [Clostridiales bacterium]